MKTVDFSDTIAASDLKLVYIQKFEPNFLINYCAILNQISYESVKVQGNKNLLTRCWSHDQDGRHAHIW